MDNLVILAERIKNGIKLYNSNPTEEYMSLLITLLEKYELIYNGMEEDKKDKALELLVNSMNGGENK